VKGFERFDHRPLDDVGRPFDAREPGDGEEWIGTGGRQGGLRRQAKFRDLLVKEGGKEQKLRVQEAKARAAFGDAAFADDEALFAAPEGAAHESPFLECKHGGKVCRCGAA